MRQVRTCDFCGDDASGLYEPLPASIPEGPRLLLCDDCRDQLGSVVDPLLARLDEDAGSLAGEASKDPSRRGAPNGGTATGNERPDPSGETSEPAGDRDTPPVPEEPAGSVVSESRDAGGRSQGERGGTPPGYRKVMRLLENRELPIPRENAEMLAADAYELEPDTVAVAIDHAIEYGRLREVDGQLKQ